MISAADCLASTGLGGTTGLMVLALIAVAAGGALLWRSRSLRSRITLAVIPLLLIAGLSFATVGTPSDSAHAATSCDSADAGAAPAFTSGIYTLSFSEAWSDHGMNYFSGVVTTLPGWSVAATGPGPITFTGNTLPTGVTIASNGVITVDIHAYVDAYKDGTGLADGHRLANITARNAFGQVTADIELNFLSPPG